MLVTGWPDLESKSVLGVYYSIISGVVVAMVTAFRSSHLVLVVGVQKQYILLVLPRMCYPGVTNYKRGDPGERRRRVITLTINIIKIAFH